VISDEIGVVADEASGRRLSRCEDDVVSDEPLYSKLGFTDTEWGLLVGLPQSVLTAASAATHDSARKTRAENAAGMDRISDARASASPLVAAVAAAAGRRSARPRRTAGAVALLLGGALVVLAFELIWLAITGLIIGALGRLVLPGQQNVSLLATTLIGIAASLLGGIVANAFDAGWFVRFLVAVALAAIGITLFGERSRHRTA
jgi:uncharacterized membrane protein YeaQ/YmgE (transglycosylase-associated protein family)